jgi:hypothetical protein
LKQEIILTVGLSYSKGLKITEKCELIVEGKRVENLCQYSHEKPVLDLDMNDIKLKYEQLFKNFDNLRAIRIRLMAVNQQFIQWINEVFLRVEYVVIEINFHPSRKWFREEFEAIKKYFGNKLNGILLNRITDFDAIVESKILEMQNLFIIDIINCFKAEPYPDIFKNLSKFLVHFRNVGISVLNKNNVIALSYEKRNNLKILKINFDDKSDSNEMLETICNNLVKLEILELSCGSLNSLEPIENIRTCEFSEYI